MTNEDESGSHNLGIGLPNTKGLPKESVQEPTLVDLGEDLLEETRPSTALGNSPEGFSAPTSAITLTGAEEIGDLLHSARILMREGLTEDAKKILRQILITDSSNVVARKLLDDIHATELKQIFGERRPPRPLDKKPEKEWNEIDSHLLMRQLDLDLKLGIFSETGITAPENQLSLFQDAQLLDDYCVKIEKSLATAGPQDWIDLGIAFLEMDIYPIAVRLFTGACNRVDQNSELTLSATSLLALSLILFGRPFEAITKIQSLLRNVEIKRENKAELFYLMGRTYESMRKSNLAYEFYRQVIEIDPHYRDVDLRIRLNFKS